MKILTRATCPRTFRSGPGFTLLELMIVITVISILASLGFVGAKRVLLAAKIHQAKASMHSLIQGISAYRTDYGRYPIPKSHQRSGKTDTVLVTNEDLIDILLPSDEAPENPRREVFLTERNATESDPPRSGVVFNNDGGGYLVDPWANHYRVLIDTNFDNRLLDPFGENGRGSKRISASVAAWSLGPDGEEGTSDDIRTW